LNLRNQEEYWLALAHAPGIGPIYFLRLLNHFGSPRTVFEAGHLEWQKLGLKAELIDYLQNPDWLAVEQDQQWLSQTGNDLLTLHHPHYPPYLQQISDPPPLLFVHGDYTLLSSKQLAIVGTRHPSREGEKNAREFAQYLSYQGFTITSGMALGIDGASHWGALAGSGKTIAVAGTGLDRVYPAQHRELAHKIAASGALVSEFFPGTPVRKGHFPRRSRIVSGLSLGTLVVEAPKGSGALYAARHAIEQNREVFAIPGSIHNPLARGCHQLIKEGGAKLVETVADILEELKIYVPTALPTTEVTGSISIPKPVAVKQLEPHPPTTKLKTANPTGLEADNDLATDYVCLLNYLAAGPTSIDNLVEMSGLTPETISSMLLMLELRGLVTTQAGGLYTRLG
jgi:DNA processing protein